MDRQTLERILWTSVIFLIALLHLVSMTTGHTAQGKNINPHDPTDQSNKFRDPEFVRNKEHVKEHLEGQVDTDEKEMTDEELEFHYFKLHDFDNNTKLDGLEIMAAISHVVPFEPPEKDMSVNQIADARVKYFSGIIDQVMLDDDYNKDGYLTYLEYVLSRRRHQDEP
ncbi:multiple coagulation factor deficiency protein 2 homolog [Strongylocentrotus purpuratus]|uniref:Multiple coagulation factor deficiency protein 2 homolog n=1 Tax=Strongylocentrotus purpuratus TaxID=7668 RepID=A0A7M7G0V2_STRPU|nr:multiple coagulation factor deficiency protein 2 homolog [Strongylocentrotus purpuratus]|eukprot:XP_001194225.2 PREDICTED: multiple coagulation factor deficiency protein 2 homolog [Strongylocentrotus purpuratus]